MSEQKPSHEDEGIACRAQRQDCVEAQIWGRVPNMSAALAVPKNTVASIILKWMMSVQICHQGKERVATLKNLKYIKYNLICLILFWLLHDSICVI